MGLLQRLKEWRSEQSDDREDDVEEQARELLDDQPEPTHVEPPDDVFPIPR